MRQRARVTAVVGAVVLAVVAAVVPLALLGRGGGGGVETVGAPAGGGWTTVEHDGVRVDVPAGWVALDTSACEFAFARVGPPDVADVCSGSGATSFYPSATFDAAVMPGLVRGDAGTWGGHVYAGDWAVHLDGSDLGTARRVLASVRTDADPVADVSAAWVDRGSEGVTWAQPGGPAAAGVRVRVVPGYPDCGAPRSGAVQRPDGRWSAGHCVDRVVVVTAPTRALADLVAATVDSRLERAPGPVDPGDGWSRVRTQGVLVDLPPGWARLDTSTCPAPLADARRTRFGPADADPCALAVPVDVLGRDALALQAVTLRIPGFSGPVGLALSGEAVVVVRGDLETRRRVLASARVAGEEPGDLSAAWEEVDREGATWQQPTGSGVEVAPLDADLRCREVDRTLAAPTGDGRWRGTYCLEDRAATVTAPTQALADLVGSTVGSDVP